MNVIARYPFPHEAHMAKASLDSVGIESHFLDEHLVNLHPHTQGKRHAFLVFLLLGFPLFFYKNGHLCGDCGQFSEEL